MKTNRISNIYSRLAVCSALFSVAFLLSACTLDRWVSVEPGEYVLLTDYDAAGRIGEMTIQEVLIDRDAERVVFKDGADAQVILETRTRQRADWPSGCPANINSTRMEVLELELDNLFIGKQLIAQPVLVRACPPEPEVIVLRTDGAIGGGGSACHDRSQCIFFVRFQMAKMKML